MMSITSAFYGHCIAGSSQMLMGTSSAYWLQAQLCLKAHTLAYLPIIREGHHQLRRSCSSCMRAHLMSGCVPALTSPAVRADSSYTGRCCHATASHHMAGCPHGRSATCGSVCAAPNIRHILRQHDGIQTEPAVLA